ncbi:MAG: hypothetical protein AAGA60_20010 [Cyanobacteria bacterium P01_E01_bin.42]
MVAIRHIVEVNNVESGSRPVTSTSMAIIGLIGTAPMHHVNEVDRTINKPVDIRNLDQARRYFGPRRPGYTIPAALDAIFAKVSNTGGVRVIVVNVLDVNGLQESTNIANTELIFTNNTIHLPYDVSGVVITDDEVGTTTYVENTDYTLDVNSGIITRIDDEGIVPGATVFVSYSYPSGAHKTTVTAQENTFATNDTFQLNEGLSEVTLTNVGNTMTYDRDIDYVLDEVSGKITRITTGAIAPGATVKTTYTHVDPSIVQLSDIIGGYEDGDRVGLQAFIDSYVLLGGIFPRIIDAGAYSALEPVSDAIAALCDNIDAMAVINAPSGTTHADLIAGRGPAGIINWYTQSKNLVLVAPRVLVRDSFLNATIAEPLSSHYAGAWANLVGEKRNPAESPSSIEIVGIEGFEQNFSYLPGRIDNEIHALNEVGICTYRPSLNSYQLFGNRSAAWPSSTYPTNFISVRFVEIFLASSFQRFLEQFQDRRITQSLILTIKDSGQTFIDGLINEGILIDGRFYYDPNNNPAIQIATGKLVFNLEWASPTPAENIVMRSTYSVSLLNAINN